MRVSGTGLWQSLIRYPIVRPQDVQVEEQREQEEVHVQPMVTEVPVAAAIEPVVSAPVVEEVAGVVEAPVQVAEPQPEVVETTHPEVIAAAVTEQPQVITESGCCRSPGSCRTSRTGG